jgi:anti-sigma B factor antagonist
MQNDTAVETQDSTKIMTLTVTPRTIDTTTTILDLDGEVDVYTAPMLKEAMTRQVDGGKKNLIVNLQQVEYLDSTGLGILIGGVKRLRESQGTLKMFGASPRITRIFDITGLNAIFDVYATEQDALNARKSAG